MQAIAGWKWGFDNLGKKWTFLVADYAWGHSMAKEFGSRIEAAGGKAQEIRAPQDTKDFVPYLQKVDPDTEVLFTVFLGYNRFRCFEANRGTGTSQTASKIHRYLHYGRHRPRRGRQGISRRLLYGISSSTFGPGAKRIANLRKAYRKACGVDDDGKEVGNPKVSIAGSHMWSSWVVPYMIKLGIEQTGWKDNKKNPDFVKAVCNLKLKAGPWCPW